MRVATRRQILSAATLLAGAGLLARLPGAPWTAARAANAPAGPPPAVQHPDADWRRMLSPAQYDVLRQEGTEMPFSSPLNHFYRKGRYACAGCDNPVFDSDTKFDSGTGWPSFWQALPQAVVQRADSSLGMERIEIHCVRCAGHLGHLFDDGPKPTGLRYCMNGVAMRFQPAPGVQPPSAS